MSRASLTQMRGGNVALQVLAIYVSNNDQAPASCRQQIARFLQLEKLYPQYIDPFNPDDLVKESSPKKTQVIAAFENASGFCSENDSIDIALKELEKMRKQLGNIAYISMTWDGENRYGGGVGAKIGLKEDGKRLLEWMHSKQIAIDLSHASDYLIDDIFNTIDKKGYKIPVLASHSNMRSITAMARNLPDELALEIIRRKGLIGMNFFCHFSGGKNAGDLLKHIEHACMLGAQNALCMGADFFCDVDAPSIKDKYNSTKCFYEELPNSSCYPYFFSMAKQALQLKENEIQAISYKNAENFFSTLFKTKS